MVVLVVDLLGLFHHRTLGFGAIRLDVMQIKSKLYQTNFNMFIIRLRNSNLNLTTLLNR